MIADAYAPTSTWALVATGAWLAVLVATGGRLQSARGIRLAWLAAISGPAVAHWINVDQPSGFRMLALCASMLYGLKAVVGAASVASGNAAQPWRRWWRFCVLWMGMRPRTFRDLGTDSEPRRGAGRIARVGVRNVVVGTLLFVAARRAAAHEQRVLAYVFGLPALSLWVHFGLFHMQAAWFRSRGADVGPLFKNPPLSRSLTEFWGRRWNLAFSEMTALAVHRPLRTRLGDRSAVTAAFLFSGLLHELAISAPVRAGWGRPMLYFGLHAVGMAAERRLTLRGVWARAWTVGWVVLPLPLLFHEPFLREVVGPLLGLSPATTSGA